MMEPYQSGPIFTRRSIRDYTGAPVGAPQLDRIIRAGMQAPTAINGRGWEFYVYTGRRNKEIIAGMSPHASPAARAAAVIVLCANRETIRRSREESWFVQGLSACTQNMLLQIAAEGLGGVWLGCYPRETRMEYLQKELGYPRHVVPFSVVALGCGSRQNTFEDRYDPAEIHYEE